MMMMNHTSFKLDEFITRNGNPIAREIYNTKIQITALKNMCRLNSILLRNMTWNTSSLEVTELSLSNRGISVPIFTKYHIEISLKNWWVGYVGTPGERVASMCLLLPLVIDYYSPPKK